MTEQYDVSLSFAGEERPYVERVAEALKRRKIAVFYDGYEEANLWGKNLYQHLSEVYRSRARYCVIFASANYERKMWTRHELASAQSHAIEENREYILPARFDDTQIPGILPTTGYIDLRTKTPEQVADLIEAKLRSEQFASQPAQPHREEIVQPTDERGRAYQRAGGLQLTGLSKLDGVVLRVFCDSVIAQDARWVRTEHVWQKIAQEGIHRDDFVDSLEILINQNYLEPSPQVAKVPPDCAPTILGFETYLQQSVHGYAETFLEVARSIALEGKREFHDIQISHPSVVLRHILDFMVDKRYVDVAKASGGRVHIMRVSAELRRLVKPSGA